MAVEREMPGLQFRTIREFHRCKAIEDVNQNAFEDIVDNLADIMGIEDNQKNEIKLAKHSQSMVNVIEDFETRLGKYFDILIPSKYQVILICSGKSRSQREGKRP